LGTVTQAQNAWSWQLGSQSWEHFGGFPKQHHHDSDVLTPK